MSFPIPSFFKIRCGIIIIAFLLFFMFIGMLKQALACPTFSEPNSAYQLLSYSCYTTASAVDSACAASSLYTGCDCRFFTDSAFNAQGLPNGTYACQTYGPVATPRTYKLFVLSAQPSCPDTNNNGKPDACETCPSQTGYRTNLLIASYCGNRVTQCNGESHTDYEWGFGPDSCTPAQEPDCHTTADCKKDSNQDGIADGSEGGGTYSGNPRADLDGDSIPDLKDCDFDHDNDGKKNCEDPCPLKSNPGTAICPDPCEGGTEQCQDADGDGIPDCTCPVAPPCWQCADGDGDGVPNGVDNDIDGDGIPNAQDSDIDGDGTPNTEDDDIDGDGVPNSQDDDDDGDGTPDDEEETDTDGDGIPDSEDDDDDGDGIPDNEEETATRPYAPTGDPYSVTEATKSEFKEALQTRFQEFLDRLKTTSLFSIPSRLRNIVPTGSGESAITVNGGQTYGEHEIDFSGWTQGLAALNAVIYIACYSIAIRIIILKR